MLKRTVLAAALLTLVATPVFAGQCPRLMKEIDAALAQNPQVAADVLTRVKALRADGETLHTDQDIVLGHPDNPMKWEDMAGKFSALVEPVLGTDTESIKRRPQC